MTESDLRWRLRQLPAELEPSRDLWPGIESGIAMRPLARRHPWLAGLALAASLTLAVGLAWRLTPTLPSPAPSQDPTARMVQAEAQAMTLEYHAALRQFDGASLSPVVAPDLGVLDRSAIAIRDALAADPDSIELLQQLRKTYALRIALTQRAIIG